MSTTSCPFAEVTSGKRWRPVLLYRIGFKLSSEVRYCTRFVFAFSKVLRKRIARLMPRQMDSRASLGRTETFVRLSTRFDSDLMPTSVWRLHRGTNVTLPLYRERRSTSDILHTHFRALHALIWTPRRCRAVDVGRVLFPQVCRVALVGGVTLNHPSRTLGVWLTC